MKLLIAETKEEFEAEVIELTDAGYSNIKKSNQFEFDWMSERENHVFKIVQTGKGKKRKIHGLISLIDKPDEYRIHINLIESSLENRGKDKKVERVAGCLIAFASQVAFEKGYYGFTSLTPKTEC